MTRSIQKSIYVAIEGAKDEKAFLQYLKNLYDTQNKTIIRTNHPNYGSNPVEIIDYSIRSIENDGYKKAFVIVDNDVSLSVSRNDKLICKKIKTIWNTPAHIHPGLTVTQLSVLRPNGAIPVIIVSEPLCFEGFIFRLAGLRMPKLENLTDKEKVDKLKEKFNTYMISNYEYKIINGNKIYTDKAILDFLSIKVPKSKLDLELQTNNALKELVNELQS